MTPPADPTVTPPDPTPGGPRWTSRRRSSSGGRSWIPLAVVAVVLAGAAWWWFGLRGGDEVSPSAPTMPAAAQSPSDAVTPAAPPEPLDLPSLSESDRVVRSVVETLSRHPRWAEWLVTDDLARRFVGSVAAVAAGMDPRARVPFLAPDGEFSVQSRGGVTRIDPRSWRRYDPVVEAFVSFDTPSAVRLYQQLEPLFDDAHRELGFPEGSFGATLATAIDNVLAVEVPDAPPEVALDVKTYLFVDPELEAAPAVTRQVMRLGPDNAREVQAKLQQLRRGLEAAGAIPRR